MINDEKSKQKKQETVFEEQVCVTVLLLHFPVDSYLLDFHVCKNISLYNLNSTLSCACHNEFQAQLFSLSIRESYYFLFWTSYLNTINVLRPKLDKQRNQVYFINSLRYAIIISL